jgi:hypothetical protein
MVEDRGLTTPTRGRREKKGDAVVERRGVAAEAKDDIVRDRGEGT